MAVADLRSLYKNEKVLLALIITGLVIRLIISWNAIGSNDAVTWKVFAESILNGNLFQLYRTDRAMNHPPLSAETAAFLFWVSEKTRLSFFFLMRLGPIAADAGTCFLLYSILAARTDKIIGLWASLAYSWCLSAIIISGYHGNSDSIYAFLYLLAFYLVEERNQFFLAGLALAGACNIKLIPVLLIFPLFSRCRSRKEFTHVFASMTLGFVPFLFPLIGETRGFLQHVIFYNSQLDRWGISYLCLVLIGKPGIWLDIAQLYINEYRYLINIFIISVSFLNWRHQLLGGYELAALVTSTFLFTSHAFGVQYIVAVLPFMFVINYRFGFLFGSFAGIFLFMIYYHFWTGTFPALSWFTSQYPFPASYVGLLPWLMLGYFVMGISARMKPGQYRSL